MRGRFWVLLAVAVLLAAVVAVVAGVHHGGRQQSASGGSGSGASGASAGATLPAGAPVGPAPSTSELLPQFAYVTSIGVGSGGQGWTTIARNPPAKAPVNTQCFGEAPFVGEQYGESTRAAYELRPDHSESGYAVYEAYLYATVADAEAAMRARSTTSFRACEQHLELQDVRPTTGDPAAHIVGSHRRTPAGLDDALGFESSYAYRHDGRPHTYVVDFIAAQEGRAVVDMTAARCCTAWPEGNEATMVADMENLAANALHITVSPEVGVLYDGPALSDAPIKLVGRFPAGADGFLVQRMALACGVGLWISADRVRISWPFATEMITYNQKGNTYTFHVTADVATASCTYISSAPGAFGLKTIVVEGRVAMP